MRSWVINHPTALQALCCQGDHSDQNYDQRAQFSSAAHINSSIQHPIQSISPVDVEGSVWNVVSHLWSIVAFEGSRSL